VGRALVTDPSVCDTERGDLALLPEPTLDQEPAAGVRGAQESSTDEPTSLYRYYDRLGLLIYAGITKQGIGRNRQHDKSAEWWPYVVRQEVDHLPSRRAALDAERALIERHRPPFNRQHNPDWQSVRALYVALADEIAGEEPRAASVVYAGFGRTVPLSLLGRTDAGDYLLATAPHAARLVPYLTIEDPVPIMLSGARKGTALAIEQRGLSAVITTGSGIVTRVDSIVARLRPCVAHKNKHITVAAINCQGINRRAAA
jgi:hypothetical protein